MKEKVLTDEEIVRALEERKMLIDSEYERTGTPINFMMVAVDAIVIEETIDLIYRLQVEKDQLNGLNTELLVDNAYKKAEIERLTDTLNQYINGELINAETMGKIISLEKQVDELKQEHEKAYEIERANIQAEIAEAGTSCHWCRQQAEKDTAKEMLTAIIEGFVFTFKTNNEDYKNGYDQALTDYDNNLKKFFKERYGVEVE